MHRLTVAVAGLLFAAGALGAPTGVTPYLPLNLEPEIEAQIERVLILGGKPVLRRPIPAAAVMDALPQACAIDQPLCERVARYLNRYTRFAALTHASVEVAATHGADDPLPDRYGLHNRSAWDASLAGYVQPSDYLLVNIGGVAYDGRQSFTGSYLSAGFSKAQLDIGFKPRWLSPMTDSSMLLSSEAPTMASVGISNYEPLTRLGLSYDVFEARMSRSDRIVWQNGYTSGRPRLGGIQLTAEPASGWAFGLNRLVQFGGGARGGSSLTDLLHAIVNPSRYSNLNPALSATQKPANQEASFTSGFLFPAPVPFAVYAEYAGEDTSRGRNYLLGKSALSWGIHFPHLPGGLDVTLEASEWQNSWYVNEIWQDGMVNDGLVVSHWFGDQRTFLDSVGGRSVMARLRWDLAGGLAELRFRSLHNENYGATQYQRYHEVALRYSHPWQGLILGGEFDIGSDVFGRSFGRVAGFVRYDEAGGALSTLLESAAEPGASKAVDAQLFLSLGVSDFRLRTDLTELTPKVTRPASTRPALGLGALRAVSAHSDLGARLDLDEAGGHSLIGAHFIDYRYRFAGPLAVNAFLGAARYALATPAYGIYYGLGLQWRNVLPHLDLGLEGRYYDSIARDHLLPSDPHTTRPDSFYDVFGGVLSLSYHF